MKISKIMAKNFAKVDEISVNIDPTRTYFVGSNKAGKTTMGYSVPFFVMKGLAQRGDGLIAERFRFIGGKGKSAEGVIEIIDEKEGVTHTATRKLLKDSAPLKIVSSDGVVRGQEFLDDLFSAILFNVMKFSELSGKEQALAFGVDTTELDKQRKALKVDRLAIYQDLNRLRGVAETSMGTEKVEGVSLADLLKARKRGENFNTMVKEQEEEYRDLLSQKNDLTQEVATLVAQQKVVEAQLKQTGKEITDFQTPPPHQDLSKIDQQIGDAEGINAKARAYKDSLEDQKKADTEQAKYDAKDAEIATVDVKRIEHIKASRLPYNNTTISDDGEFRLNSKPFNATYFSTGECMNFGARLASKIMEAQENRDQLLEYVYMPHAESLDQESRDKLFKELADLGLQVVAEFVLMEKIKKENCILLKEMQVVDSYDEKKKGVELT